MSRPYPQVVLAVKSVPEPLMQATAVCPSCSRSNTSVRGRVGLRLVFRCPGCRVDFFRPSDGRLETDGDGARR
jgi:transposase-like protein